ncbi:hypothetical protein GCM10020255_081010 [Rhodococcus baikonurensis]
MSLSQFTAPWWLLFLAVIAALVVGYVLVQKQRAKHTLRFTNFALLEKVAPSRPGRWRHIPAILMVVALVFFTVALAGPTADKKVPRNRATVILVIDVSLSMQATDVEPTRLAAAQEAAKSFADGLTPESTSGWSHLQEQRRFWCRPPRIVTRRRSRSTTSSSVSGRRRAKRSSPPAVDRHAVGCSRR